MTIIIIKRSFIAAVLSAIVMLCSCSAAHPEPAPPKTTLAGCVCSIEYAEKSFSAAITTAADGNTSVTFNQPESMSGLTYTFTNSSCRVSLGELSFTSDDSALYPLALPQMIHSILQSKPDTSRIIPESGEAEFSGMANGFRYTITTEAQSGTIKSITSKTLGLEIQF